MLDLLKEKLAALENATKAYRTKNSLAAWVYIDIAEYIARGKASRDFEKAWIAYPDEELPALIERCLKGNMSCDGIIQTTKRMIGVQS